MGRNRTFQTNADRQRAYRQRLRANGPPGTPGPRRSKPRPPSRPARLAAIDKEVTSLLNEYEAWHAALPPSLAESDLAEKLEAAIAQLATIADSLAEIELPRGFGRD